MEYYTLKDTIDFRVPTVEDALVLREQLENNGFGQLIAFNYKTKQIKVKGEVVEEYQVGKATIQFTTEKEPDVHVKVKYEY